MTTPPSDSDETLSYAWFFQDNNDAKGPFQEQQILELIRDGSLSRKTLVWTEGMENWSPAEATVLAMHFRGIPPPIKIVSANPLPTAPAQTIVIIGQTSCPLCGDAKHMLKAKPLYGHMVCKKCYYRFASRRQMAFLLDWILTAAPIVVPVNAISKESHDPTVQAVCQLIILFIMILFCFKDCFSGHSLGKVLCGIRVIDSTTGKPCGIVASFKRNLPLLIPFMPLFIAGQLCKGRRIGDGWANTKVIWKKYANCPIFSAPNEAD